jgi:hypothetical protein
MPQAFLIVALVVVGIPAVVYALWITHRLLGRLCVRHAQRFCSRSGLEVRRARWQPEFEPSGVKTEFTLVHLDCVDLQKQRRLVVLSVWPFGVRKKISEERYPESLIVIGRKAAAKRPAATDGGVPK